MAISLSEHEFGCKLGKDCPVTCTCYCHQKKTARNESKPMSMKILTLGKFIGKSLEEVYEYLKETYPDQLATNECREELIKFARQFLFTIKDCTIQPKLGFIKLKKEILQKIAHSQKLP